MIVPISKKSERRIEIDLNGPEGNAYCILGLAKRLAEQLHKDYDDISARMKSGDYENLLKVFDEEFGEMVVMYRDDGKENDEEE